MSLTRKESFKKSPRNHVIIVNLNWNMSATVVKCPRCFWHDNFSICSIFGYDIRVDIKHIKEAFARCNDCGATRHENMKTSKVSLCFPSEDKD